jgi:hypothetical protein
VRHLRLDRAARLGIALSAAPRLVPDSSVGPSASLRTVPACSTISPSSSPPAVARSAPSSALSAIPINSRVRISACPSASPFPIISPGGSLTLTECISHASPRACPQCNSQCIPNISRGSAVVPGSAPSSAPSASPALDLVCRPVPNGIPTESGPRVSPSASLSGFA